MLPEIDGFSLMEYIRPMEIPVIFLTAKNAVNDRVKGLELGAEDYLVKPYEIIELLARVNVVLRRYNKTAAELRVGGLVIDTQAMLVSRDGETISLTPKEYELLLLFARNPGIALYRETIYERVWKEDFPYLAMIILVSFGYFFRGLLAFAVSLLTTKKAVVIFVPIWYFTNHFGFHYRWVQTRKRLRIQKERAYS